MVSYHIVHVTTLKNPTWK